MTLLRQAIADAAAGHTADVELREASGARLAGVRCVYAFKDHAIQRMRAEAKRLNLQLGEAYIAVVNSDAVCLFKFDLEPT